MKFAWIPTKVYDTDKYTFVWIWLSSYGYVEKKGKLIKVKYD